MHWLYKNCAAKFQDLYSDDGEASILIIVCATFFKGKQIEEFSAPGADSQRGLCI